MSENEEKINVLFLCTGNACRSQMAEGWARHLKGDVIEAFSAGIRPIGVSSRAIRAMAEAGVDMIDETPRKGTHGTRIAFLHPKSTHGVLTELCEVQ